MTYKIFQLEPFFGKEEIINLEKAIKDKWVTEGPFSKQFLSDLKKFTGAKHLVLANNGTLALYLSLLTLDIKQGDEVIVPDFTFNASASSIAFTGAKPVFVDVNENDLQIDTNKIEAAITPNTKVIMPVHIYGQACDMDHVVEIARKHNLYIVEDAAQGYGISYKGTHTGTIGDTGIISFFADKTITTGEGAVVMTNDDSLYEKLRLIRNQGRPNSGTFIHPALGMNFRMTDLQCAVGVAQMQKFEEIKRIKKENHEMYYELLKDTEEIRFIDENSHSNFIPFRVNIRVKKLDDLLKYMEKNGIQTRRLFYPLHKQPCYSYLGYKEDEFPVSNNAYKEGMSLPVHCGLTHKNIQYVCDTILKFYKK